MIDHFPLEILGQGKFLAFVIRFFAYSMRYLDAIFQTLFCIPKYHLDGFFVLSTRGA